MIGFIGLGNMASAIIGGLLKKKLVLSNEILGTDKLPEAVERCKKEYGIETASANTEVASKADVLFLAVKPQFFPEVIAEIKDAVREDTVEGCTAVVQGELVSDGEMEYVKELLKAFGTVSEVQEKMIDIVVGISGSSPAYVFMFIEAMADAAVLAGMPRKQAYEMSAQAVLGSAKLLLETGKHPGELKDMVCSPAGTTIEAVKVLEEMGFRATVIDAVDACIEKSRNM